MVQRDHQGNDDLQELNVISGMPELVLKKEREERRRITQKEIAEETGLTEHTVGRWMSMEPLQRIDSRILITFVDYFQCEIADLLILLRDKKP